MTCRPTRLQPRPYQVERIHARCADTAGDGAEGEQSEYAGLILARGPEICKFEGFKRRHVDGRIGEHSDEADLDNRLRKQIQRERAGD